MTGMLCLILGLSLFWYEVIVPVRRRAHRQITRRHREAVRMQKIRSIRSYYPGLFDLTPKEIEEQYDVDQAYDNICRW